MDHKRGGSRLPDKRKRGLAQIGVTAFPGRAVIKFEFPKETDVTCSVGRKPVEDAAVGNRGAEAVVPPENPVHLVAAITATRGQEPLRVDPWIPRTGGIQPPQVVLKVRPAPIAEDGGAEILTIALTTPGIAVHHAVSL